MEHNEIFLNDPEKQKTPELNGAKRCNTLVDEMLVTWEPDDVQNPQNWSLKKKWVITAGLCFNCLAIAISATVVSPTITHIALEFDVDVRVATLVLSLYVLGWAMGPMLFSPMSEIYGRNVVYIPTWGLFFCFTLGAALAKDIQTLLVCRLLGGIFSSPLTTNFGGSMTDTFTDKQLGPALFLTVAITFLGPALGPIIGGYLTQLQSWRWVLWFLVIYIGVSSFNWAWLPETHHQTILTKRAECLRRETENISLQSQIERHGLKKSEIFKVAIWRPLQILIHEPIVALLALYISFVWGVMYIYLGAYPIVFGLRYGWREGDSGAAFAGIGIGVISSISAAGYSNKLYLKLTKKHGNGSMYPEGRLPLAMIAAVLMPVSCFWFAWTSRGDVHWMAPVASGMLFGWSMIMIFLCSTTYIASAFPTIVASALAGLALLRCLFAAAFPLFTSDLYATMKPEWAGSMIGFITIGFAPIPFLFYRYGPWLRAKSRFTPKYAA